VEAINGDDMLSTLGWPAWQQAAARTFARQSIQNPDSRRRSAGAGNLDAIVERIQQLGLPNFYGPQRFGRDGETLQLGMALLRKEELPRLADGRRANLRNPFLRKLALSAAQANLFNQYLAARMADGLFRTVVAGDVMARWPFAHVRRARSPSSSASMCAKPYTRAHLRSEDLSAADQAAQREAQVLTARADEGGVCGIREARARHAPP